MNSSEQKFILTLRQLDLEREKSKMVLDKSIWLYFLFMIVGITGFVAGYVSGIMLQAIVIIGFLILLIGTVVYTRTAAAEKRQIARLLKERA